MMLHRLAISVKCANLPKPAKIKKQIVLALSVKRLSIAYMNKTDKTEGQTRFDTIFEAILAKNILARKGGSAYDKDCLQSIERALSLAASLVNKRDNQPQVVSVWNQNVI